MRISDWSSDVCSSDLLMVDDDRFPLRPGEIPVERSIRFRTLGCYPLTGAVESNAATLSEVIQEMLLTTTSERQGRAIDKDGGDASMEKKRSEERRVGKECVRTCRSRGAPTH